jgi:hypothetical protein
MMLSSGQLVLPWFPTPFRLPAIASAALVFLTTSGAQATFSIVAVDTETRAVGGAVLSCIGDELSLSEVLAIDPEVGAAVSQSYFLASGRDEVLEQLVAGQSPEEAIAAATDPTFSSIRFKETFSQARRSSTRSRTDFLTRQGRWVRDCSLP